MWSVIRTQIAEEDLLSIWLYIAQDSVTNADRVISKIDKKCQSLVDNPRKGQQRDELAPGLRSLVEGQYVIFYRLAQGEVQIIRILHGARDLEVIDFGS